MENDRGLAQYFADNKNPDPPDDWLPVLEKRKRPKSPPLYATVPGFNPVENDILRRPPTQTASCGKEVSMNISQPATKSCTVGRPQ